MDELWLSFYHKRVTKRIQKTIYFFRRKYSKIHNFYSLNREKVTRIDKNGEKIVKNVSYMLQCTDSARFMANSFLNLVNNLSEGLHWIRCKLGYDDKKCETCGIKYKYCDCFLEYKNFKDNLIE